MLDIRIDKEKLLSALKGLINDIEDGFCSTQVTIGEVAGVVFSLKAYSQQEAMFDATDKMHESYNVISVAEGSGNV